MVQGLKVLGEKGAGVTELRTHQESREGQRFQAELPSGFGFIVTAPELPVAERDFQHGFCGFMEPAILSVGQVALQGGNGLLATQMNVGRFPAHAIEKALFIALFRQSVQLDVAAIRRQATH